MTRGPHPLNAHLATAWVTTGGDASRMAAIHKGIRLYQQHNHKRTLLEPPTIWQLGSTRLLNYGDPENKAAPIVLVVPSFINPAWVLDLDEQSSMLRWLSRRGVRAILVDWGQPGEAERQFDIDGYVTNRLSPALEFLSREKPVAVMGYCLGGTLAVAMAALHPTLVSHLILLAAPWDFLQWPADQRAGLAQLWSQNRAMAKSGGGLSMEILQLMFAALDPGLSARKFETFAKLDQNSSAAQHFVVLEDWANAGAPLSYPVAEQFFDYWLGDTPPAKYWRIGDTLINPAILSTPSLSLLSVPDRIVPLSVTEPLVELLADTEVKKINAGHVGMVVGSKARGLVWQSVLDFLANH
jgi:polyhydroxyalkanoate synthase subunit PhaC